MLIAYIILLCYGIYEETPSLKHSIEYSQSISIPYNFVLECILFGASGVPGSGVSCQNRVVQENPHLVKIALDNITVTNKNYVVLYVYFTEDVRLSGNGNPNLRLSAYDSGFDSIRPWGLIQNCCGFAKSSRRKFKDEMPIIPFDNIGTKNNDYITRKEFESLMVYLKDYVVDIGHLEAMKKE
ncbi:1245_t:CDS:2 [Racocetra fulgida]|uniref:1245_t:CDS:1 n=1 Tax=Racocetra fulgida TaxID=60492 RepID=A0A9N9GT75_9GLOM|nr:1245_t:CDS:2 [Racocetra fulgida]